MKRDDRDAKLCKVHAVALREYRQEELLGDALDQDDPSREEQAGLRRIEQSPQLQIVQETALPDRCRPHARGGISSRWRTMS